MTNNSCQKCYPCVSERKQKHAATSHPLTCLRHHFYLPFWRWRTLPATLVWFSGLVGGSGTGTILYHPKPVQTHLQTLPWTVTWILHKVSGCLEGTWWTVKERQKAQLRSCVLINQHWLSPLCWEPGDAKGHLSSSAEWPQLVPGPASLVLYHEVLRQQAAGSHLKSMAVS